LDGLDSEGQKPQRVEVPNDVDDDVADRMIMFVGKMLFKSSFKTKAGLVAS
jgi:hypothetical protein